MNWTGSGCFTFVVSAALSASMCGSVAAGSTGAIQPGAWLTYTSELPGFALQYPDGWEKIRAQALPDSKATSEAHTLGIGQVHKVTFREIRPDMWQGEFRVCVWSVPDTISFEDWLAAHEPTDVTGASLVQDVCETHLGGRPARRLSIFGFDHEEIGILCLHGGRLYQLSFVGANPNDPDADRHAQIYAAMVESFQFLE